jgi:hypothetical protein
MMGAREGTVLWLGPPIEADMIDLVIAQAGTPHEAAFRVVEGPCGQGMAFSCREHIKAFIPEATELFESLVELDDEISDAGLVRKTEIPGEGDGDSFSRRVGTKHGATDRDGGGSTEAMNDETEKPGGESRDAFWKRVGTEHRDSGAQTRYDSSSNSSRGSNLAAHVRELLGEA